MYIRKTFYGYAICDADGVKVECATEDEAYELLDEIRETW
jgi:hypothetical protein